MLKVKLEDKREVKREVKRESKPETKRKVGQSQKSCCAVLSRLDIA
jgi:hypothetical protein